MQDFRNTDDRENTRRPAPNSDNAEKIKIEALVVKAVKGDSDAFGDLYTLYVEKIYRYIYYHVKNKTFAEDVTGEAFYKAWRAIGSCKGKESTFSAWLYRIAHNHMVDEIRKQQRHSSLEIENVESIRDTKARAEGFQEQQELSGAIDLLPPNQKRVIILKFIEGLDNREIARIMKKSEGAIRVLQMRALAALKKGLA